MSRHNTLASLCQDNADSDIDIADDTYSVYAASSALHAVITVVTWNMVREATASDKTFVELIHHLETGFPTDCREQNYVHIIDMQLVYALL